LCGRIKPELTKLEPSFFEVTVAMAFDYFSNAHVDVAVIEVGLGGRLDSTNVITPLVSLITNIGHDHMDLLGNTFTLIAGEKAGIIKRRVPVVISEHQPEVEHVFREKAASLDAPLFFSRDSIELKAHSGQHHVFDVYWDHQPVLLDLVSELKGAYQSRNIAGVLMNHPTVTYSGLRYIQ